jgi:hypothetical protein
MSYPVSFLKIWDDSCLFPVVFRVLSRYPQTAGTMFAAPLQPFMTGHVTVPSLAKRVAYAAYRLQDV